MKIINAPDVPAPAGHYAHAIQSGNLVFISGQLPTGLPAEASLTEQVELVLQRTVEIAKAAGSDLNKIVKTTVYVTSVEDWPEVNKIYAAFFGEHKPARAIVPVKELHYGYRIEIEAIAEI
jgi:2-iminobutanoate/2-iminopropanoate deaminase